MITALRFLLFNVRERRKRRGRLLVYSPTITPAERRRLPFYHFCDPAQELIDRAAKRAPTNARCVILPHGGVTYPRVTAD